MRILGWLRTAFIRSLRRSVLVGARSQYHVATSSALANTGGQLFSDSASAFTECGKSPEECGQCVRYPATFFVCLTSVCRSIFVQSEAAAASTRHGHYPSTLGAEQRGGERLQQASRCGQKGGSAGRLEQTRTLLPSISTWFVNTAFSGHRREPTRSASWAMGQGLELEP